MSETKITTDEDSTPVWGAKAIGLEINKSDRETFYLLERGLLPAKKIGRTWVSTRGKLRAAIAA